MNSIGMLCVSLIIGAPITTGNRHPFESCSGDICSRTGASLLQFQKTAGYATMPAQISGAAHISDGVVSTEPITGKTANLTEDGYDAVVGLCCTLEMKEFARRMIESNGSQVCHEGGLTGFSLWHDCADDKQTYASFITGLEHAHSGECPWASSSESCPPRNSTCNKSFPNATLPPCIPKPIVCCKPSLLQKSISSRAIISKSKITPWDCKSHPEPIQVLHQGKADYYNVSKLDIMTGKYKPLWNIQLSITTPNMNQKLNSIGINPIDSIMYGSVNIDIPGGGNAFYIVRLADGQIEFVGQLPPPNARGYNAGTFSPSGTFYIATYSKSTLRVIKDLAGMDGFPTQSEAPVWTDQDYPPIPLESKITADVVALKGSFDGGSEAEYVLLLDNAAQLIVVKTADSIKDYQVVIKATSGGPKKGTVFGAGWNFQGRLFFATNNGGGVYEIQKDTIKTSKDQESTIVTLTEAGLSTKTSKNDGANCLDAPSPWCESGWVNVDPVDGKCPEDSTQQ
jgi:hypothetical protein